MTHRSSWRMGALASAIALLGSLAINPAYALGLGRITVQSALGEALRAEIDIPEISADEAASLRVGVAAPAAFKAAGLEYTATVVGVQIDLRKRADGRSYLSLTSVRPVTEPFVDLILEASWASGKVVRDYTMLFDPPNLRQSAAPIAPSAPVLSRSAPATASPPFSPSAPPPTASANRTTVGPEPVAKAAPVAPRAASPKPPASSQQVQVKPGDTAGKIAMQSKPASISLEQMLVAMLKSNPDAFISGNVNRLKSGAVLDMPSADEAGALPAGEATSTIVAQSKDFNNFRRKLASGVPGAQVESANRQVAGKVQAKVEDRAATTATPDKLTLSKGALQGKAASEDTIAKDKQAKDAATRVAELAKNIGDLNKIAGITPAASSSVASPSSSTVAGVSATLAALATATSVASAPAATVGPASASAPVSSAPVAVKKPVVVAAPPPPEPSLIDELTDNPLVLPGLGALLALLAGFGFYRFKKRDNSAAVDSSFLESRLQPDSFFGASGGQRIDTSEGGNATGSSMVYSPSQLDAAGDVDPVAEADVYLAYGRDLQAEEILKEALRTNPARVAIHAKLMEIYAKRRDVKAFEVIAAEAFSLTSGNGPEWAYICEMGRDLDPGNPMYMPGGEPDKTERGASAQTAAMAASFGTNTVPQMLVTPGGTESSVDFDLDLDFSVGDDTSVSASPQTPTPTAYIPEPTVAVQAVPEPIFDGLGMDFITDAVVPPAAIAPTPMPDSGMLEFDLGSLSLDLDGPVTQSPALAKAAATAPAPIEGPLETKFALAEEFRALGDSDGARSLASEVVAQAQGALKTKAQAFLNALS